MTYSPNVTSNGNYCVHVHTHTNHDYNIFLTQFFWKVKSSKRYKGESYKVQYNLEIFVVVKITCNYSFIDLL